MSVSIAHVRDIGARRRGETAAQTHSSARAALIFSLRRFSIIEWLTLEWCMPESIQSGGDEKS